MTLTSFGCFGLVSNIDWERLFDEAEAYAREAAASEDNESNPSFPEGAEGLKYDQSKYIRYAYGLDMFSAEAFIADVNATYNIFLKDHLDHLSSHLGRGMMLELGYALSLFSPTFIRELVAEYEKHDASFIVELGDHNDFEYGITTWRRNLTIVLYHDRNPNRSGITAAVLTHELAHAAHFIIEEYIGEERSEREMTSFNGKLQYVEDMYDEVWRPDYHSFYFAYDYGMYDYYEDIATIMEWLVAEPDDMFERLSDHNYEALFGKAVYIRDIMYYYISDECSALFMPLYRAEEYREDAAA